MSGFGPSIYMVSYRNLCEFCGRLCQLWSARQEMQEWSPRRHLFASNLNTGVPNHDHLQALSSPIVGYYRAELWWEKGHGQHYRWGGGNLVGFGLSVVLGGKPVLLLNKKRTYAPEVSCPSSLFGRCGERKTLTARGDLRTRED